MKKIKAIAGYGTLSLILYSMITHPIWTLLALALISTGIAMIEKQAKK